MGGHVEPSATSLMVRKASGDLAMAYRLVPAATRSFIRCEGRNVSTRRGMDWHLFAGLWVAATRAALSRTEKVPNEEIFTVSRCQSIGHMAQNALDKMRRFVAAKSPLRGIQLRSGPCVSVSYQPLHPQMKSLRHLGGNSINHNGLERTFLKGSPAQDRRTPSEAAADGFSRPKVACFDLAVVLAHTGASGIEAAEVFP